MEYLQYNCRVHGIQGSSTVLNLIINGIPSILKKLTAAIGRSFGVLNLIINGIPSILYYQI